MAYTSEMIKELEDHGVPADRANDIAAQLLEAGANACMERIETAYRLKVRLDEIAAKAGSH